MCLGACTVHSADAFGSTRIAGPSSNAWPCKPATHQSTAPTPGTASRQCLHTCLALAMDGTVHIQPQPCGSSRSLDPCSTLTRGTADISPCRAPNPGTPNHPLPGMRLEALADTAQNASPFSACTRSCHWCNMSSCSSHHRGRRTRKPRTSMPAAAHLRTLTASCWPEGLARRERVRNLYVRAARSSETF